MNLVNRMLRGLLVTTALLLTCTSIWSDWLLAHGDLSDSFSNCMALLEAQRKHEQLMSEAQDTTRRVQSKSRIAEALRNGEITLVDAAAYFRSLHEGSKSWCYPNRPCPDQKDGEAWCRLVIEWTVRNSLYHEPVSQTEALHERLESELQKQLDGRGALILPQ